MWDRFVSNLNRFFERTTMLFVILMVALIFLQIVSRFVFSISFAWPEELARYLMIWVVFLGAGFAFQYGAHINIDVLFLRLPEKMRKACQVLVLILSSLFLIILIVQSINLIGGTLQHRSPALGIPMAYVYAVIPFSGLLQIINLIDISKKVMKTGQYPGEV